MDLKRPVQWPMSVLVGGLLASTTQALRSQLTKTVEKRLTHLIHKNHD